LAKKTRAKTPGPASQATPVNAANQAQRLESRRDDRVRGRQAAAEARRRQKRIQRIAIGVVALLIVLMGGFYAFRVITEDKPGEQFADRGREHIADTATGSNYSSDPPTSGPHWTRTDTWGVHTEPVPNELQIHNLEHGGIVIQYNSSVSEDEINQLEQVIAQCNVKLLLAPRPDMQQRIAVTAWTYKLDLDTVDRAAIDEFISAHVNKGPENIPTESQLLERCEL
jgi:hypothetical protein